MDTCWLASMGQADHSGMEEEEGEEEEEEVTLLASQQGCIYKACMLHY